MSLDPAALAALSELLSTTEDDTSVPDSDAFAEVDSPASSVAQILREALAEECECGVDDIGEEQLLGADLGLTELGLWAVIAQVEAELKQSFADSEIRQAQTVADLIAVFEDKAV